jgi:hypothetical protein
MGDTGSAVWATLELPGYHQHSDTPAHRRYLQARHRHLFRIRVELSTDPGANHVDPHDLQGMIRAWWGPHTRECGTAACAYVAAEIGNFLTDQDLSVATVDVAEDGECGATIRYR